MDYPMIDQTLLRKNLSSDPAFDDLCIAIETIPRDDTCPLGLYYPDTKTIVIPPDALEATLLHELGHRHGHYYYDDLSEPYAEYFRKIYQPKGRALLYVGDDIRRMPRFGALFEEGEKGAVELAFIRPLTPGELYEIKNHLYSYGETPTVYYGDGEVPFIRVEFTRGVDWMVIIGATLAGLTAITAGIIGYAIYKVSKESPWMAPVAIFGVIAASILGIGLGVKYAPQLIGAWERART